MNFTDVTPRGQSETIAFEAELPHPPEKVWRALTEPALVSEWLLPVLDLPLAPGGGFAYRTEPQPGWDGTVSCRVLEVERHRRLSYTWVVGEMLDTVVTFTLTPTPGGTHLSLVHGGFREEQKRNAGGARYGWRMMGERLVHLLGRIP
jgi:uncharacterized protein YndB with AHSA1/START domain